MVQKLHLQELAERIGKATQQQDLEALQSLENCFRLDKEPADSPLSAPVKFDHRHVQVDHLVSESDSALAFANAWARGYRTVQYQIDKRQGIRHPVIVSDGDSWFQYPIRLDDVIDGLMNQHDYQIRSLGAAGDLISNMVQVDEFTSAISEERADIFLISGGGNDMLGGGRLTEFLHSRPASAPVQDRLNPARWQSFLQGVAELYMQLFDRLTRRFPSLQILCHGYDYALPQGQKWLGKPLTQKQVPESQQEDFVRLLIDDYNERLMQIADQFSNVSHVDCRGAVGGSRQSWFDELHPTNAGFKRVTERFHQAIQEVWTRTTQPTGPTAEEGLPPTAGLFVDQAFLGNDLSTGNAESKRSPLQRLRQPTVQDIARPSLSQAVSDDFMTPSPAVEEAILSAPYQMTARKLDAMDLPRIPTALTPSDPTGVVDHEPLDQDIDAPTRRRASAVREAVDSIVQQRSLPEWLDQGLALEHPDDPVVPEQQEANDADLLLRPPCESLQVWQAHLRRDRENLIAYEEFRKLRLEFDQDEDRRRIAQRQRLLPIATLAPQERILGESDLFQINYLSRGVRSARAVGRISVFNQFGISLGSGTGFLVGDHLLLTNHHVLPDAQSAQGSHVLFEYEYDEDNRLKTTERFELSDRLFCTSRTHDFTFVAVQSVGSLGNDLAHYGKLQLISESGKALKGEPVSIIQHADGLPKQIAIRNSRIVGRGRQFIYYITDTNPGSSGSPVVNDQWIPVALHHRSVPHYFKKCEYVANRGIRISSIFDELKALSDSGDHHAGTILQTLTGSSGSVSGTSSADGRPAERMVVSTERNVEPFHELNYEDRQGYDPDFLGLSVGLPQVNDPLSIAAPLLGSPGDYELKYEHFSVVINRIRRLALFTAANVDLAPEKRRPEPRPRHDYTRKGLGGLDENDREKWFLDPRIAVEHQIPDVFYNRDRQAFHKGHLVRRVAVAWGTTYRQVRRANGDTFHVTNCSPQVGSFNVSNQRSERDGLWGDLENLVERHAASERLSVFSGPLFSDQDRDFVGRDQSGQIVVPIPSVFWKLIVARHQDELQAFAFWLQQDLTGVAFEFGVTGEWRRHQVSVAELERKLGTLTFPDEIHDADTIH